MKLLVEHLNLKMKLVQLMAEAMKIFQQPTNLDKRQLMIRPNITTRGFVLVNENASLIKEIENKVSDIVNKSLKSSKYSVTDMSNH